MKSACSMLFVSILIAGSRATEARAQAEVYGAFLLRNPSDVPIRCQVRWGNGPWTTHAVEAGRSQCHYYPLDATGRVPRPQVRFDWIAGDDAVDFKTYTVHV